MTDEQIDRSEIAHCVTLYKSIRTITAHAFPSASPEEIEVHIGHVVKLYCDRSVEQEVENREFHK